METDWRRILSEHGPAVWRTVRFLVGNEADAGDCYQTVFLDALRFSQNQAVEDWGRLLARFARMRALDLLRKRYRVASHIDPAASVDEIASRSPSPQHALEAAELAQRLRDCLASIPEQQAEVFVMRYFEQLSYEQIAERTGSNRNAVGAMLNRARGQLRELLDMNDAGGPSGALGSRETLS